MSNILVNATAIRSSGALSILYQFIENIPNEKDDVYYIFVDKYFCKKNNAKIVYIEGDTRSWIKRILWDEFGLNKWVKSQNIRFDLFISFQNTGARIGLDIPQLIYYHQPLPLSNTKWSPLKKEEIIFFLYKNVYSFFVKRYLGSKTHVVVQIPSIKVAFARRFRFDETKLHVIKPNMCCVDYSTVKGHDYKDDYIHCIYPATPLVYKGHDDIISALHLLKEKDPLLLSKIRVHFTFKSLDRQSLLKKIISYNLESNIVFEGIIPYRELLSYYKSSHMLLFPSYIETLGLPLLEASAAGIPIIVSDLPFAQDVVGIYDGATFVRLHDIDDWCNAIIRICRSDLHYKPYTQQEKNDWLQFFELIDKLKK